MCTPLHTACGIVLYTTWECLQVPFFLISDPLNTPHYSHKSGMSCEDLRIPHCAVFYLNVNLYELMPVKFSGSCWVHWLCHWNVRDICKMVWPLLYALCSWFLALQNNLFWLLGSFIIESGLYLKPKYDWTSFSSGQTIEGLYRELLSILQQRWKRPFFIT